jgi:rare lipoprotein A (peptidoglycan hydrolase)
MNKAFTTIALFIILTTSAMADPVTDFFGGIFGGQSPQQTQTKVRKTRHARHTVPQDVNDGGSADFVSYWGHSSHGGGHMVASFYGHGEHLSRHTASGALFNPRAYTAAHRTYPFGTVLRVCHRGCVNVTVNDRGPFVRGRSLDLSYGAARAIGMGSTSSVSVERLN